MRCRPSASFPLRNPSWLAAALAAWLLAAPVLAAAAPQPGASSPQELVARMRAAVKAEDYGEVADCMAPDDRADMALGLLLGVSMMVGMMQMGTQMADDMAAAMEEGAAEGEAGGEQAAAEPAAKPADDPDAAKRQQLVERYNAMMKRHGLEERMNSSTPPPGDDPAAARAALLAGVDQRALIADLMGLLDEFGENGAGDAKMEIPEQVTDYKITGDQATARAGDRTLRFVRVDGRWYAAPDPKPEGGAEDSPMPEAQAPPPGAR